MSGLAAQFGLAPDDHPMRKRFLGWQCRCRLMMMREHEGRPTDAVTPEVTLAGEDAPMGHVITMISRLPAHSVTPELQHMAARTPDPAKWREDALKFFSEYYYQKPDQFSDILTATFVPGSAGAARLRAAGEARLVFEAYAERFDLPCRIWKLSRRNPLRVATMAHNKLFNPGLHPDTEVLGFEPVWDRAVQGGAA